MENNRAYVFKTGMQAQNEYANVQASSYIITGTAYAKGVIGQEANRNGTKIKGGNYKQIPGIDLRAGVGVSGVNVIADGHVGYKDYVGLTAIADASAGKAQAYATFTARIDNNLDVGFRAGAEAAVFDGAIGVGLNVFGYEAIIGIEGSAIAAGAIAELGVLDGRLRGRAKAALGLGGGVWFSIGKR
ncbi:hypothetical protein [Alkaliphilus transvaalensis]|uniref:hypothetical protein n=1 Tax=Alkaliphilus transvaalensis TaxID=114628 RepID=UPI00047A8B92|nr:hypothetical protein [Alkaliphilus transvaalensis]